VGEQFEFLLKIKIHRSHSSLIAERSVSSGVLSRPVLPALDRDRDANKQLKMFSLHYLEVFTVKNSASLSFSHLFK
jgi:hypothetical protein